MSSVDKISQCLVKNLTEIWMKTKGMREKRYKEPFKNVDLPVWILNLRESEVAAQSFSVKKVFLEISQKLKGKHLCQTLAQVFYCGFCEISKNIFSYRTPLVAASEGLLRRRIESFILSWKESIIQISWKKENTHWWDNHLTSYKF